MQGAIFVYILALPDEAHIRGNYSFLKSTHCSSHRPEVFTLIDTPGSVNEPNQDLQTLSALATTSVDCVTTRALELCRCPCGM